jgi:hypothetical protein
MIKLIASDLDGTLLPPSKIMPQETFGIIEQLYNKGIIFAPSSGRQLPNLQVLFAPVLDKIAIIAENGGLVYFNDQIIYSNPTPPDSVRYALAIIRQQKGLHPVISTTQCAYYEDDLPAFTQVVKRSYSSEKLVKNLDDILYSAPILKISVWDEKPAAEHGGKILPPKIEGLRTMISGYDWLDVSTLTANKGVALSALREYLKLDRDETCAFGDHMNDLEMLQASGHPFVTANAFPQLKEQIGEVIPSNADFGVITKLKEILSEA